MIPNSHGCNSNDKWILKRSFINSVCTQQVQQVELNSGQLGRERERERYLSAKQAHLIRDRSVSSTLRHLFKI